MPLEEWAFFFCIPYACIFTYEAFRKMIPRFKLSIASTQYIVWGTVALWIIGFVLGIGHLYTMLCFGLSISVLIVAYYRFSDLISSFIPVFIVLLIPFILVNGLLTGGFSAMEIVSYNDMHNLGIRIFRIPIEDFSYAFTMILMSLFFIRLFDDIFPINSKKQCQKNT
jgi:lycopene cyclase domain-containing protein